MRALSVVVTALLMAVTGCETAQTVEPPDAGEIALAADAAPPGMAFDGTGEGETALTVVVISGRGTEFRSLAGFKDGHYRTFSGDAGAVLSLALVFDDAAHADEAFTLYLDELESDAGYGLDDGRAPDWGDEGTCASGPVPTPLGEETICLWRSGSVVMAIGGAMDPDRFEEIGAGMDHRARAGG